MQNQPQPVATVTKEILHPLYKRLGKALPVSAIKVRLGDDTRALRSIYHKWDRSPDKSSAAQWLCDNFYVLEKEARQTIRALSGWRSYRRPKELSLIYKLCQGVFGTGQHLPSAPNIQAVLDFINAQQALTVAQLDFFPLAIKAALIALLAQNATAPTPNAAIMETVFVGLSGLGAMDFEALAEEKSIVEQLLLQDPSGTYPQMTAQSRRQYRGAAAYLAIARKTTEQALVQELLSRASAEKKPRQRHVGYFLLADYRAAKGYTTRGAFALGFTVLLPLWLCIVLYWYTHSVTLFVLGYFLLLETLRPVAHGLFMRGVGVDIIPRIKLEHGAEMPKTIVTISTLLPKPQELPALRTRLEQLYFSNSGPNIAFCLLADFAQSDYPQNPEDQAHARGVIALVEELNQAHNNAFMLFLRRRSFCKTQQKYTGWERKRGAITELIRYAKGEVINLYSFTGVKEQLQGAKYLIALDADTCLSFEGAERLIAAAQHPLNQPVIDKKRGIVVEGYGVFTPRMGVELQSAGYTAFSRLTAGSGGVTAYDTAAGDLYQDLFSTGIFAGKGLVHIDSFYQLLSRRFPNETILSHDILEGAYLRTAFVSDIEMTDCTPQSLTGWLARLHRWIRGDWQNLPFLLRSFVANKKRHTNPISLLSRYMLLDNLRRSLTPPLAVLAILVAGFFGKTTALWLCLCAVAATVAGPILGALGALFAGGLFGLSRKYFVKTQPLVLENLSHALLLLVALPKHGLVCADAILRTLYRMAITRRGLLQWATAAQTDKGSTSLGAVFLSYLWPQLLGLGLVLLAPYLFIKALGLLFCTVALVVYYSARPTALKKPSPSATQREQLISYCAAMWRYFEKHVTAQHHYLPPDNVQEAPVYRVAARTSPTNIGMYLLSILAVYDCKLIELSTLRFRIEKALDAIEELETHQGNLYNWYDTNTLALLQPRFVSSVDSGNFVACLTALVQGLEELTSQDHRLTRSIARLQAIIDGTDLSVFYNKRRGLLSVGYDPQEDQLASSHYDFLMSEARLTSYYALARRQVSRKHWGCLVRTMSKYGAYAGPVSWTGTMFEYFMPHLLLPAYAGSLLDDALRFCIYCQRRRVRGTSTPWGISESSFYGFDRHLNYQYKAHGVQQLGVKRGLDRELVISPYSTFLTLPYCLNAAMENLQLLQKNGAIGECGFYEALDYTPQHTGKKGPAIVRSYMAHHIGMSILSISNVLEDGRMQKRFMRDKYMASAYEFLQEKVSKTAVVFENLAKKQGNPPMPSNQITEAHQQISPLSPRVTLLTNGALTSVSADTGAGFLRFGNVDITRRPQDSTQDPQGIFAVVNAGAGAFSLTQAPFFSTTNAKHSAKFSTTATSYYAKQNQLGCSLRFMLHKALACMQLDLQLHNAAAQVKEVDLLFYLEPILCQTGEYMAHPAFAKLFVTAGYDETTRTLSFTRQSRNSTESTSLTVGFLGEEQFDYILAKDQLLTAPQGLTGLLGFAKNTATGGHASPDAICALKLHCKLPPRSQHSMQLLLSVAKSPAESLAGLAALRAQGGVTSKTAAASPIVTSSIEGRLGLGLLKHLLWPLPYTKAQQEHVAANSGGQSLLWPLGISGDRDIVLLDYANPIPAQQLEAYLKLQSKLHAISLSYDLILLSSPTSGDLWALLKDYGITPQNAKEHCVYVVDTAQASPQTIAALQAAAAYNPHSVSGAEGTAFTPYTPQPILGLCPAPLPSAGCKTLGGMATQDGFVLQKLSPLPWCHVLANSQFGTLVSDNCAGFTWCFNSRESRLTPWDNDTAADLQGEGLYLQLDGKIISLTKGARVQFTPSCAQYSGSYQGLDVCTQITVSSKGLAKQIRVQLTNQTDTPLQLACAYYVQPVLAVTRSQSRYVLQNWDEPHKTLLMHNPHNTATKLAMGLSSSTDGKNALCQLNREEFFMGNWQHNTQKISPAKGSALIIPKQLPPRRTQSIEFVLTAGASLKSALTMAQISLPAQGQPTIGPGQRRITLNSPDGLLNSFINVFAPHQIVKGRLWGRTGFSQSGGAFGFRDQLQDVQAALLLQPSLAKTQIYRACRAQFLQGDVLHWWHNLPKSSGGLRGVRTRYSDDLLWLPYTVARYLAVTGDETVLHPQIAYLEEPPLAAGEAERYCTPKTSTEKASVYQHCLKAIARGYNLSPRGLPLMGGGDWNDGFNQVGASGKGESVWLAMFLSMVLEAFAPVCTKMGDAATAADYLAQAQQLRQAVDQHCWDGSWYIRAFYDDGTPLGAAQSSQCQIDLLPQSFAVLAGMPNQQRVTAAMASAGAKLVDWDNAIIKLFAPPFAGPSYAPGYVSSYPKGVRENGGQYTHAAVWYAMAVLESGKVDEGLRLITMLNPLQRYTNSSLAHRYKLEPYYMPGDIYSGGLAGRGGWSIYTGAVSWYYRAVLENLCGLQLTPQGAVLHPKLPADWPRFSLTVQEGQRTLHITVRKANKAEKPTVLPLAVPREKWGKECEIII